jgi:cytochrome P450
MQDYASKVIAMRKAEPRNDLISNFAWPKIDGDRLDDREVLLTTTTLIMAGVESLGGFMMMFAYNLATLMTRVARWWPIPDLLPDASKKACASTPRPSAFAAA